MARAKPLAPPARYGLFNAGPDRCGHVVFQRWIGSNHLECCRLEWRCQWDIARHNPDFGAVRLDLGQQRWGDGRYLVSLEVTPNNPAAAAVARKPLATGTFTDFSTRA